MNDSGFGGGVAVGAVLAETADAKTGDGGGNNNTGCVFDGGILLEERGESVEYSRISASIESSSPWVPKHAAE